MNTVSELFETLPGLAWRSLANGRLDVINPGMLRYIGVLTEASRADWRDFLHPDDRISIDLAPALEAVEANYPPMRIRRYDGQYRWFQCTSRNVLDSLGALTATCTIAWDIHDAMNVSDKMHRKEAAIKAIVECIPGFVWQLGSDGELCYLNTKVFDYTGKTLQQLREPGWRDSVHPDDVESFIALWTGAIQKTAAVVVEFRLRRFDGAYRWFRTTGEPVLDPQGRVVSWCGVDIEIDNEKRTSLTLRHAQSQLARAAQLAIAAELTASTANAINQPLAAIVANAFASQRWLSTSPPALDRVKLILGLIEQDSKEVADVVNRIMAIIRRAPPIPAPINMNAIIEDVLGVLTHDLQEFRIGIRKSLEGHLPVINGDAALFQQVLLNLIRNGIDALREKAVGDRTLYIDSRRTDSEMTVQIGDDGIGFLDEAPLFDAFYTTKADGLGLGLAIVRSIVESYGGRVWARHRSPTGSNIGFTLPL